MLHTTNTNYWNNTYILILDNTEIKLKIEFYKYFEKLNNKIKMLTEKPRKRSTSNKFGRKTQHLKFNPRIYFLSQIQ
jgi:hypothetical protein